MSHYLIIIITFLFSAILWETSFLYPLKMLAVLIHEFWHSLVALPFNVDWIQFHIFENEAGKTILRGNVPILGFILIASAGYIGTVFTASLFLRSLIKKELYEVYYLLFCGILFIISFVLTSPTSLTFYISFLWSIFLIFLYFFKKQFAIYVFSMVQSFILFYSFYDLLDFSRDPARSDIGILYQFLKYKQLYHGDIKQFTYIVSTIWIIIIIMIFYKFILSLMFDEEIKVENQENSQINNDLLIQNHQTETIQQPILENSFMNDDIKKILDTSQIPEEKSK